MQKNGGNLIVIVLLVLIIAIQAGSLFYRAPSQNCRTAINTADSHIEDGNAMITSLADEFEVTTNAALNNEQMLDRVIELQIKAMEVISLQHSALLNVLANCQ
jgi:hypothetical protein